MRKFIFGIMVYGLIIGVATIINLSCIENSKVQERKVQERIDYSTITIDSCEYIKMNSRLAHKGNCKYCKERNRKMIKDILMAIDYE